MPQPPPLPTGPAPLQDGHVSPTLGMAVQLSPLPQGWQLLAKCRGAHISQGGDLYLKSTKPALEEADAGTGNSGT